MARCSRSPEAGLATRTLELSTYGATAARRRVTSAGRLRSPTRTGGMQSSCVASVMAPRQGVVAEEECPRPSHGQARDGGLERRVFGVVSGDAGELVQDRHSVQLEHLAHLGCRHDEVQAKPGGHLLGCELAEAVTEVDG